MLVIEILKMLFLTILQNTSFTLVSRARNSNSLVYHGTAAVLSNGIWLLVIKNVVTNFDKPILLWTYLVGSVTGSLLMHHVAMKYFEKPKGAFDLIFDTSFTKAGDILSTDQNTSLKVIKVYKKTKWKLFLNKFGFKFKTEGVQVVPYKK
jgi:hypothetical protein